MYAIVKTGGKQYRVERGQRLLVERLSAAEGESVALQPILYRSEEAVFDKAGLAKVKVTAKVLAHERGEKLRVFKFKPKRGYKRRTGHRQELTRIEVTELGLGGGQPGRGGEGQASAGGRKARVHQSEAADARVREAAPARSRRRRKRPSVKPAAGSAEAGARQSRRRRTTGARQDDCGQDDRRQDESPRHRREGQGDDDRWRIRRDSGRAATGATPTLSASA